MRIPDFQYKAKKRGRDQENGSCRENALMPGSWSIMYYSVFLSQTGIKLALLNQVPVIQNRKIK